MELIVGANSTWSLRAWICARLVNVNFSEKVIDLDNNASKDKLRQYSPTGLVPVLKSDGISIHDSLAIVEYLNELTFGALYPISLEDRALARSLCAELHSGFKHIRSTYPFTLSAVNRGAVLSDEVQSELSRIETIFSQAEGAFMFSSPSAVDAFYSVLAYRLQHYGIYLMGDAGRYQQSLLNWSLLKQAIQKAEEWRLLVA